MSNQYYLNSDVCDYTDEQIQNHNQQIDKILKSVEQSDSDEQYNDYFLDSMKDFSDRFCNSISTENPIGNSELYRKFI